MRILYISRSYTPHDRRFLEALARPEHEVWCVRLESGGVSYEPRPVPPGVRELAPLSQCQAPLGTADEWIRLAPRLEAVLAQVRPDVVQAGPIQQCAFLVALVGFDRLLAVSWGSDLLVDADRDEFWTWMTRYALRRSALLVTDCDAVSRKARQLTGLAEDRIVQFPWGVDLTSFHPGRDELALRPAEWENCVTVISTRSWEPSYGVLHLLEGFRRASSVNPRLRLLLLGDGTERERVRRFIDDNRLGSVVCTMGAIAHERLPAWFRAADVYASCAYNDGSSLSLLEAMATGLPVLATSCDSNREWIAGPENGCLAPFAEPGAIASALIELAAMGPAERAAIGRANRLVVEQRADWRRNAQKLLEACERLAGSERGSQ
jgi:glycosyltransferase involved in cell wall biosynthesis